MKKILTLFTAIVVAVSIRMPVTAEETASTQYQTLLDNRQTTYEWYQEFRSVVDQLPEEHRPETLDAYFDSDELQLFYRVVAAEIGSEQYSFAQRVNVASVIINRWIDYGYPSVEKVLTKDRC